MRYIFMLLFFSSILNAQEFYICDHDGFNQVERIKMVDANFNVTTLAELVIPNGSLTDIAFSPNGTLYGITSEPKIIEIDLATESYTLVTTLNGNFNNMVCSADNELWLLNSVDAHLIKFSLDSMSIVSNILLASETPGDLTFYKGNMLFQELSSYDMKAYDGSQCTTVACGDNIFFFGMANYVTDCDTNLIYAFEDGGRIFEYDVENASLDLVADIYLDVSEVFGATTLNDYMASACTLEPLDYINCNLGVSQTSLSEIDLYPNPVSDVMYLNTPYFGEELYYTLYSLNGKLLEKGILENEMDLQRFASGIYFLKLHNADRTVSVTKKIIKD